MAHLVLLNPAPATARPTTVGATTVHMRKAATGFSAEDDERVDAGARAPAPGTDVDLLLLLFSACQRALSVDSRVALVLPCLGGLTTPEIARAVLLPGATVAQRIVRAKRTLAQHPVDWQRPEPAELAERLASVLEVVYLLFNEGYSASTGSDWTRPDLCHEGPAVGRTAAPGGPG